MDTGQNININLENKMNTINEEEFSYRDYACDTEPFINGVRYYNLNDINSGVIDTITVNSRPTYPLAVWLSKVLGGYGILKYHAPSEMACLSYAALGIDPESITEANMFAAMHGLAFDEDCEDPYCADEYIPTDTFKQMLDALQIYKILPHDEYAGHSTIALSNDENWRTSEILVDNSRGILNTLEPTLNEYYDGRHRVNTEPVDIEADTELDNYIDAMNIAGCAVYLEDTRYIHDLLAKHNKALKQVGVSLDHYMVFITGDAKLLLTYTIYGITGNDDTSARDRAILAEHGFEILPADMYDGGCRTHGKYFDLKDLVVEYVIDMLAECKEFLHNEDTISLTKVAYDTMWCLETMFDALAANYWIHHLSFNWEFNAIRIEYTHIINSMLINYMAKK